MKKLLLTIIALATAIIISFTIFAGCSQVSQLNKLSMFWADYESFVYDVHIDGDTEPVGSMVMTINRIKNSTTTINDVEYTFNGSYCEMQLNITEGEGAGDSIYSKVAFKSPDLTPIASYKITDIDGTTTTTYIRYNTSKNSGTITLNGEQNISFKHSATSFDNEMLYLLVRASDLTDANYSMSFSSPNNLEGESNSMTVARSGAITINTALGEIECSNYTITAAASYGDGTSLVMSIAKNPVDIGDNTVVKPIVRIKEGAYSYTLSEISLVNPQS